MIMECFWEKGALFVKELLELDSCRDFHFNTLSTFVRGLEKKGFLAHKQFGNTYQYYPIIGKDEHKKGTLKDVICKYFNNSGISAVSALVKEEAISLDELRDLIREVEK